MKIAYLIVAHNNYEHLKRLITALDEHACRFYIHIDKKSPLPHLKADNIIFLQDRVNVHWSGFSMVRVTLNLLHRAIADENDYFVLISGADYPIQPNSYLYEKLKEGGEYITIKKGCDEYNPLSRYKYYIYFFKTAFCSDECFFQTIISNSEFYHQTKDNLTYSDWSVDPGPAIITEQHIDILKNVKEKFFARKFNDDSFTIIERIEKELRNSLPRMSHGHTNV